MAFTCNHKEYMYITLSNLKFDERVSEMVEKQGVKFPYYLLNNIYNAGTFKLVQTRLDRILEGYEEGLPPVLVKEFGGKYIVLNGRHRICATILRNGNTVPCTIYM
jgi:hypothetical protein